MGVKNHGYSVAYTSLISRAASAQPDFAVGDFTSTTTRGRPLTQYTRSNRREVLPGTVMLTSSDTTSVLAFGCSKSMTLRACHTPSASRNSLRPRSRCSTCSLARTSPPSTALTVATISSATASTSKPSITPGFSRTMASRSWPATTVCVVSRGKDLPAVKVHPMGRDHWIIRFWNSRSRMPFATAQTSSSADSMLIVRSNKPDSSPARTRRRLAASARDVTTSASTASALSMSPACSAIEGTETSRAM